MDGNLQEKNFLILIVDDIAKNIQLLGKILDNQGYGVVAVTDSDRVLETAKKHEPDLILLDIMMPGKSGYEVCEELKSDQDLSDIPIIFLTARSEEEDVIKGLNLGGADYVTKPFNSGELLARIETHLSLKRARDQVIEQQQKLQQLTKTKEKLYSIIAHDLKGALFGISGLAEVLQSDLNDQNIDKQVTENINLIHQSAHSANQILENLLSWTRMQGGEMDMDPKEFSLSNCIEDCIDLYQIQAKKKQVDLLFDGGDAMLYADRQMISTIFRNLISNAIKFSENGDRIFIEIDSNSDVRKVMVKDEGLGMPENVRENIFNPQDRPKREGTEREKGTGLGLLLCKEFVEMHNGEISVESEPGQGTQFEVILPKNPLQ